MKDGGSSPNVHSEDSIGSYGPPPSLLSTAPMKFFGLVRSGLVKVEPIRVLTRYEPSYSAVPGPTLKRSSFAISLRTVVVGLPPSIQPYCLEIP